MILMIGKKEKYELKHYKRWIGEIRLESKCKNGLMHDHLIESSAIKPLFIQTIKKLYS